MRHKKSLLVISGMLFPSLLFAVQQTTVTGSDKKVIEIPPEASTGLKNIFVVYDTNGCSINFRVANPSSTKIYRFGNAGASYAEEVRNATRSENTVSVPLEAEDTGFVVEEDGSYSYYCWVVNYANHFMTLNGISASDEQECEYSVLNIDGKAPEINYYTIVGQRRTLSRQINVDYTTQEFDESIPGFVEVETNKIYDSLGSMLSVNPPAYCTTYFIVSGDRFLEEWGMPLEARSSNVAPVAVDCSTEAIQENIESEEGSNVMGGDTNGLGGSAPADVSFLAYTTEGVIHYEWQMSREPDFNNPEYRFYQKNLDYTFTDDGTFYLRFIGSNADGTCETIGDTYSVTIGASALEIPNAFSPNDDGINDIWKVSYRSLIEFHCEIFNRNGQRIYSFDDPSGGWDGSWNGKKVKSGVYYYVITAVGSDGQKYKKSGDINILISNTYSSPGNQETN